MSRSVKWTALVALLALTTGCKPGAPSASAVRAELEHELPAVSFEREAHIRLGRVVMAFARGVVRLVDDDPETRRILSHVRRLEVSSYAVSGLPDVSGLGLSGRLERRLGRLGWEAVVRQRDEGGAVWIFARPDGEGSIRNLFIVDLEPEELTIVDLTGRLDRLMADAIADDPGGFAGRVGS